MRASIITVGDEILIGQVIDSNSAWLGQKLSEIGISVRKIWSVADESGQIILGMKQALEETDILFMTGGLGPTKDDITKKAIADFLEETCILMNQHLRE
jgi:nicotinamide-nucleotide amidase